MGSMSTCRGPDAGMIMMMMIPQETASCVFRLLSGTQPPNTQIALASLDGVDIKATACPDAVNSVAFLRVSRIASYLHFFNNESEINTKPPKCRCFILVCFRK
jgi:hypothetical protein